MSTPTIYDMANAVGEVAADQVRLAAELRSGNWIGASDQFIREVDDKALRLLAAERELRSMLRLMNGGQRDEISERVAGRAGCAAEAVGS